MLPTHREPTSPGRMLQIFMEEYKLTQMKLAQHLEWTTTKINQIINNKRAITPETALSLSDAFGNSAQFWMNGQLYWDLWHAQKKHEPKQRLQAS